MDLINTLFEAWYAILVLVLLLMVPIWFGTFLFEVAATVLHRRREKR
jgi:hypothetical protein